MGKTTNQSSGISTPLGGARARAASRPDHGAIYLLKRDDFWEEKLFQFLIAAANRRATLSGMMG